MDFFFLEGFEGFFLVVLRVSFCFLSCFYFDFGVF